jgi:glucose-1-phosphate cytidylyltransferase
MAFKHEGFWQPMDTLRDKQYLEKLWETNKAPWKVWKE